MEAGDQREEEKEVKSIEDKLQELLDEHIELEREGGHLNLLKKKKSWVVYDAQHEQFNSLKDEYEQLIVQNNEIQAQLKKFEESKFETRSKEIK